tara:strand:- start:729 stop:1184 length:456 start_codon:yes stop_codon:yes gene_type:complete
MNKDVTKEDRKEIYKDGLKECICDDPGECQLFMLFMSQNNHNSCKTKQSSRDWFLRSVKRRDTDKDNYKYQQKIERQKSKTKVDNAILALKHQGVSLKDKESAGLGDTVTKVLKSFGITKEVISKVGSSCKCEKRRAWLNTIFPYGNKKDE